MMDNRVQRPREAPPSSGASVIPWATVGETPDTCHFRERGHGTGQVKARFSRPRFVCRVTQNPPAKPGGDLMNWFTVGWVAWVSVTVGGFLALEIPAIIRKNDSDTDPDTLSDHLVKWFAVKTSRRGRIIWTIVCLGLAGLVAWVYPHILTGQAV